MKLKFQIESGSWYLKLKKNKINKYQMAKIGLTAPMNDMVKVWSDFQGLTNETNNFAFEVNTEFRLESTILDGQSAAVRSDGEAGISTSTD